MNSKVTNPIKRASVLPANHSDAGDIREKDTGGWERVKSLAERVRERAARRETRLRERDREIILFSSLSREDFLKISPFAIRLPSAPQEFEDKSFRNSQRLHAFVVRFSSAPAHDMIFAVAKRELQQWNRSCYGPHSYRIHVVKSQTRNREGDQYSDNDWHSPSSSS